MTLAHPRGRGKRFLKKGLVKVPPWMLEYVFSPTHSFRQNATHALSQELLVPWSRKFRLYWHLDRELDHPAISKRASRLHPPGNAASPFNSCAKDSNPEEKCWAWLI